MKLIFQGHTCRYAVEQSLLAFFPQEKPVYEGDDRNTAFVTLCTGEAAYTATTTLTVDGKTVRGVGQSATAEAADAYEAERLKQRAIQLSFFRAAQAYTGIDPPWGALTGIRPAKLAAKLLAEKGEAGAVQCLQEMYHVSPKRRQLALACARAELEAQRDCTPRDISLYVGIPFCPTRCAYCSFVSNSVEKSFHLVEPYLETLRREIAGAGQIVRDLGLRVRAFYMGGGTPTTLTAAQMDTLLGTIQDHFDLTGVECTVEAGRPDTITAEKLGVLRRRGITRISVNPQSMSDRVLAAIGRRHTAEDIRTAMALAMASGISHINMDLIAGLPEDSVDEFRQTLREVLSFRPDNITVHTLALKKGSRIMLEETKLPNETAVENMLDLALEALSKAGFSPYYLYRQKYMSGSFENTGWAKDGAVCLYNIYIMGELHSILSLGAGGSTKMVDPEKNRIERVFNLKYPREYVGRPEKIAANQAAFRKFYEGVLS